MNIIKVVKYKGVSWPNLLSESIPIIIIDSINIELFSRCTYIGCISFAYFKFNGLCIRACCLHSSHMCAYVPAWCGIQTIVSMPHVLLCMHTILFGGSVLWSQKNIIVNTDITADPRITNIPPQIN